MAKRQNPINKSIINCFINSVQVKDLHCFTHAIINFLIMGIQTGWRGVEWAQPKCPMKHGFYEHKKASIKFDNQIYALCIEDITFKYASGRIVTNSLTVVDANVAYSLICWRYQKNLNHRQKIKFEA